nr:CDP-alcohol phosphatidyltransferase family protein [Paludibaculum fermentans]
MLRPLARFLARSGVTANHVTVAACLLSVGLGLLLTARIQDRALFLVVPGFLFVRMALNAVDGMLAREFGQKSDLGAYLNELADVISDGFLLLPFAYLPEFEALWIGGVIWLSALSEMAGTVAVMTGAGRRYDGPMGKSDRAFVFGALALWIGAGGVVPGWLGWGFPRLLALLLAVTIVNRVLGGLGEKKAAQEEKGVS